MKTTIPSMLRPLPALLAATAICFLAGCSDPANTVPKSAATAPQQTDAKSATPAAKAYVVRAESKVSFIGSKVTGKHDGGFKNFSGTINVADGKIVTPTEIKIAIGSIWTDTDKLTGHLKSKDFFDAAAFPVSTFTVTGIEPGEGGKQKVTGNLDLHGVTKSISFPADIHVADDAVTVQAEFAINRRDFNINYPGQPNNLIRDNVVLKLDVKATPGDPRPEDKLAAAN